MIDHFDYIVRYGELSFESPVKSGVYSNPISGEVEEGRILGYVKRTKYVIPMLHFEMFSGDSKGPLTVRSNKPTQRRSDLLDPTDWLVQCSRVMSCKTPSSSVLFGK